MNIKMDLLRVAKSALDIRNDFDEAVSITFLDKAMSEFKKIEDDEKILRRDLEEHRKQMGKVISDPLERLRWGEKILTIASRLSEN